MVHRELVLGLSGWEVVLKYAVIGDTDHMDMDLRTELWHETYLDARMRNSL